MIILAPRAQSPKPLGEPRHATPTAASSVHETQQGQWSEPDSRQPDLLFSSGSTILLRITSTAHSKIQRALSQFRKTAAV
jgi:hypothetical protein